MRSPHADFRSTDSQSQPGRSKTRPGQRALRGGRSPQRSGRKTSPRNSTRGHNFDVGVTALKPAARLKGRPFEPCARAYFSDVSGEMNNAETGEVLGGRDLGAKRRGHPAVEHCRDPLSSSFSAGEHVTSFRCARGSASSQSGSAWYSKRTRRRRRLPPFPWPSWFAMRTVDVGRWPS